MTEEQKLFFSKINALGTGERAALRREAGKLLHQADGKAITAFYACLPTKVKPWLEDQWFAAACLRCLWDPGEAQGEPLEQVIADLIRREELSESTKHRVELLIDTRWDSDGYLLTKLTRLIKLIWQKSDRVMVDFSALLDDLTGWNADSQYVQRKWARAIFSTTQTEKKER